MKAVHRLITSLAVLTVLATTQAGAVDYRGATTAADTRLFATVSDRHERWFRLHNLSPNSITAVFATDVGDGDWRGDIAPYVIAPGDYLTLEPTRHRGYCRFDLRVDYSNGSTQSVWNVNLCVVTDVWVDGNRATTD